jgi:hypothetical protein
VHLITYSAFGLLISNLFDYTELFQREVIRDFMRPVPSKGCCNPACRFGIT